MNRARGAGIALTLTIALSTVLGACGTGKARESPATPRGLATPAPAPSGPVPTGSIPAKPLDTPPLVVNLLDPGSPPRRELRYTFSEGDIEHFEVDVRVASLRTVEGRPQEVFEPPTFRMHGRLQAKSRDAEGVVLFAFIIDQWQLLDDVELEPDVRQQLESEVVALSGLLGRLWVSPRGHIEGMGFRLQAPYQRIRPLIMALDDVFRRGFAPFPSEAVGIGAKWDVVSPDEGSDLRPMRHDVYSLVEGDEGGATIERSSSCSAAPQALPPPRENLKLDMYEVKGDGQLHPFFTKFIGGGFSSSSQLRMEISPRAALSSRVVWTMGAIVHVRPARHDVPR